MPQCDLFPSLSFVLYSSFKFEDKQTTEPRGVLAASDVEFERTFAWESQESITCIGVDGGPKRKEKGYGLMTAIT